MLLVEKAVAEISLPEKPSEQNASEIWGAKGYYLVESCEFVWSDLARLMAQKAVKLGYFEQMPPEKIVTQDVAMEVAGFEAVSWGLNSRGKGQGAEQVLGWRPSHGSVEDAAEAIIKAEYENLRY